VGVWVCGCVDVRVCGFVLCVVLCCVCSLYGLRVYESLSLSLFLSFSLSLPSAMKVSSRFTSTQTQTHTHTHTQVDIKEGDTEEQFEKEESVTQCACMPICVGEFADCTYACMCVVVRGGQRGRGIV
jgi:hypothetical protein